MPFVVSVEGVERARVNSKASFSHLYGKVQPFLPEDRKHDLVRAWRQLYGRHEATVAYGLVSIAWDELESTASTDPTEEIAMTRERD